MAFKSVSKFLLMTLVLLAKTAFAGAACADCQTVDFGKRIELKLLQPMLQMTIPEKLAYIRSFGVDLYKVADPEKLPVTVGDLPEATTKRFAKKYIQLFSEGVVGLYMTPSNSMYGVTKPTILFIDSSDDWTVIHEFTHYLFDRVRMMTDTKTEGQLANNSEDAQEDFFNARDKYRNFDRYVDEEHKRHTIMSFINYAQVQMIFSRTSEFEETTIEKILRTAYEKQKPHGFLPEHFERSTRYIRSTSEKGQQNLDFLLSDCEALPKTLNDNDTHLKNVLAKTCERVQSLKQADLDVLKGLNIQLSP